jgi:hypothetical protein
MHFDRSADDPRRKLIFLFANRNLPHLSLSFFSANSALLGVSAVPALIPSSAAP